MGSVRTWILIGCWLTAILAVGEVTVSWLAPPTASVYAQEEEAKTETAPQTESYLSFLFKSLGIKYTVAFLALSFCLVAFMVMNMLASRRDSVCPPHLAAGFEANLNEKKYQEAFEMAKNDDSMLGQVLASGMAKLSTGFDSSLEAMNQTTEDESMKIDRKLTYISLIGTISPMVGLLGTVDGMVASFQVIAMSSSQPKPSELASGISQALVTTLVGLWLAIPAIISFTLLKIRMNKLIFDVAVNVENLMGRFATMGKK